MLLLGKEFWCDTQAWLPPLAELFSNAGAGITGSKPEVWQEQGGSAGRGAGGEVGAAAASLDRLQLGSSLCFPGLKNKVKIILLGFT